MNARRFAGKCLGMEQPEDLVGKTDYDVFPKEYAETYRANDLRVLEHGRPLHIEETVLVDETVRTFLEVKFPVFDANGTAYGVCGIATDITERERAETLLQQSEAYFRELTQAMPIVVRTNLPDGRIDFVNRHWLDYTGQTLDVVLGAPGAWISALHPDDRARAGAIISTPSMPAAPSHSKSASAVWWTIRIGGISFPPCPCGMPTRRPDWPRCPGPDQLHHPRGGEGANAHPAPERAPRASCSTISSTWRASRKARST